MYLGYILAEVFLEKHCTLYLLDKNIEKKLPNNLHYEFN